MPAARLIIDPPAEGSWNMAVDEALLESAAATGQITLRFYEWSPATLSLGYFQAADDRRLHPPSLECPLVRRSTGGGAILHDRELTYSLIVPINGRFNAEASAYYDALHETLVETLAQFDVQASLYRTTHREGSKVVERPEEPFLCFQRRAVGDVVAGGLKVAGSAQRRHRGTLLQHGSVLLRTSAHAPELPGISDLAGREIELEDLRFRWLRGIAARLELELESYSLTPDERRLAQQVQEAKFGSADWTRKR